jgi:hypothetical protein
MLISFEHNVDRVDVQACFTNRRFFVVSTKGCEGRIPRIGDEE